LGFAAVLFAAASGESAAPARVEARSANLMAVGVVHDDGMAIRLSRLIDNAPVRDAAVTVTLRGVTYPTTAEADGSFMLRTKDLAIPGAAAVEFQVVQAATRETSRARCKSPAAPAHRTTGTPPAALVVGAQFRRVHRFPLALFAPAQSDPGVRIGARTALEPFHGLHQHLESLDPRDVVERKREIDVQHVSEAGASISEPQTKSHVPQQPGIAVADDAAAPGTAHVGENGAPTRTRRKGYQSV